MKPSLVIIGLGNPGKEYEMTRHNAGFLALDFLRENTKAGDWYPKQKFLCECADATVGAKSLLLVKPTTYMNRSGESIKKIVDFFKLDPAKDILVVVDDVDLPLGTERMRTSGGPGTHNGLKSVVEIFGENFPRFRIGIGPQPVDRDLAAWVLSRLTNEELRSLTASSQKLLDVVQSL